MKRYWTIIRYIDGSGHGIIAEYSYKASNADAAEELARIAFNKHSRKMYGEFWKEDLEIISIETAMIVSGLQNQRTWRNPKQN